MNFLFAILLLFVQPSLFAMENASGLSLMECLRTVTNLEVGANTPRPEFSVVNGLHSAIKEGKIEEVKKKLQEKPGCSRFRLNGKIAIHLAATHSDNQEIFDLLLKDSPYCLSFTDNHGLTPFVVAVTMRKHKALIAMHSLDKSLVNRQECVKSPNGEARALTPLHVAAMLGFTDVAKTLLDLGANYNACGTLGMTPLELLLNCCPEHTETIALLKEAVSRNAEEIVVRYGQIIILDEYGQI